MKLTKTRLKQIIKEELSTITDTDTEIPERWLQRGKAQVEVFRKAYPNVIGDLGSEGEEELSRKLAREQYGSDRGGNMAVKACSFERILLTLLDNILKQSPTQEEEYIDEA